MNLEIYGMMGAGASALLVRWQGANGLPGISWHSSLLRDRPGRRVGTARVSERTRAPSVSEGTLSARVSKRQHEVRSLTTRQPSPGAPAVAP